MRNLAASVRDRIRNLARTNKQDMNALLDRYGAERLLYRVTQSAHSDQFILKGAQLLVVHTGVHHRPTRDIDLLGLGREDAEEMARVFRDVCETVVIADGLEFVASSVTSEAIREESEYGGIRVRLIARLDTAKIPLQIDIGFGDAVTPAPEQVTFPALLDGPAPQLSGYPLPTVVAEKLESLVSLGLATSRMKDVYDLWFILGAFDLPEIDLREALRRTFERRKTIPDPSAVIFTSAFWEDDGKLVQWRAFRRRSALEAPTLEEACRLVAQRLRPLLPTAGRQPNEVLRESELERAYADAAEEEPSNAEADAWDTTAGDGLGIEDEP